MLLGLIGVIIFSMTLPFTRLAVAELDPVFIALGRAVVAGVAAALLLWHMRAPIPTAKQWRGIAVTAAGCVVGFPLFTSLAMRYVPAAHGAIVVGILPMATAVAAAVRFGERPSAGFWAVAGAGSAVVVAFALWQGGGTLAPADLALFIAVAAAGIGYAEGGRLSQTMGGQQVISWALIVSLPFLLPVTLWTAWEHGVSASMRTWAAFGYVSLFSMFIGFFFWYKGLAIGGIARVGQVQLLQPFMTMMAAVLILGEAFDWRDFAFAAVIVALVVIGKR
ncbi:MAG: DMT family transporter, partial [Burkholderiaceae bacterium]|nr:DMT family transporter [Burkholderiaceae bacterium]